MQAIGGGDERKSVDVEETVALDAEESTVLLTYLTVWLFSVGVVATLIVAEYDFPSPLFYAVLLSLPAAGLLLKSNGFAVVAFLAIAGLQSGAFNRPLGIIRIGSGSSQTLFHLAIAGATVSYLAAQHAIVCFIDLRKMKIKPLRLFLSAFTAATDADDPDGPSLFEKILWQAATVPLWPALAFWLWWTLLFAAAAAQSIVFGEFDRRAVPQSVMLVLCAVWVFGAAATVARMAVSYLSQRRMSATQARLELNDSLWREHRREMDHHAKTLARAARKSSSR